MEILQIRVWNGELNQIYATVLAKNDFGEIMVGNTGLVKHSALKPAINRVVSALAAVQGHVSLAVVPEDMAGE